MVLGATPAPAFDSGLERDYDLALQAQLRAGLVTWFKHNAWKFNIGGSWYTPDFAVLRPTGIMELHETKGFMREAAYVRLRAAAALYPMFEWFLVKRDGAGLAFSLSKPDARPAGRASGN